MKKIILMVLLFVSMSFAGENTYDYFVTNFATSTTRAKPVLIQSKTGYNNSCGPTSLLFINNWVAGNVTPVFIKDVASAKLGLNSLYDYIGIINTSTTTFDQLKYVAKNKWRWTKVIRMSSSDSTSTNVENLINSLKNDKLNLIVLKENAIINPVGKFEHIVIVYAYNKTPGSSKNNRGNDDIYFFDPYYGGTNKFKVSDISNTVKLTNFAYLQVAP